MLSEIIRERQILYDFIHMWNLKNKTYENMFSITQHQGNTNQNHNEIPSHLSEWLTLTTQATTDVGEHVEKEEPFCTAGGNANWCSYSGKEYRGSSKS